MYALTHQSAQGKVCAVSSSIPALQSRANILRFEQVLWEESIDEPGVLFGKGPNDTTIRWRIEPTELI